MGSSARAYSHKRGIAHTNTHTHIHPLPHQPIVYTRGLDIFLDYRTRRTQCENLLFDFITQCFIYYVRIQVPPSTCAAWLCARLFLFLFFFFVMHTFNTRLHITYKFFYSNQKSSNCLHFFFF